MLDTPVPGAIDQPGRELSYSFSGTVGQPIVFDVIFNESNGIGFTLRDPSGSAVLTNITSDQSVTLSANGTLNPKKVPSNYIQRIGIARVLK
jgi:hypothetical protein